LGSGRRSQSVLNGSLDLTAARLLKLADKYAMPQATTTALSLLCGWLPAEAPTVFALAVIHGHLSIARCAFGSFESKMPGVPSYQQGRSRSLAEVPEALFDEIPRVAFRHDLTLQDLPLIARQAHLQDLG
jgi:hypothetical protein